jgi:hypothetical protein
MTRRPPLTTPPTQAKRAAKARVFERRSEVNKAKDVDQTQRRDSEKGALLDGD